MELKWYYIFYMYLFDIATFLFAMMFVFTVMFTEYIKGNYMVIEYFTNEIYRVTNEVENKPKKFNIVGILPGRVSFRMLSLLYYVINEALKGKPMIQSIIEDFNKHIKG